MRIGNRRLEKKKTKIISRTAGAFGERKTTLCAAYYHTGGWRYGAEKTEEFIRIDCRHGGAWFSGGILFMCGRGWQNRFGGLRQGRYHEFAKTDFAF